MRRVLLLVAVAVCLGISQLRADDIYLDPATLHVGTGAGTSCAQGCAGDPNQVGGTQVSIYQNSAGAPTLASPILVIVGIPNDPTNLFGSTNPIGGVTWYNPYSGYPGNAVAGTSAFASAGTFGLINPVSNGFFGDFTSSSSGDIYSFLGLPADTNSNNWTNWASAASSINGITASNFGIYVFAITGSTLSENGLVNLTFTGQLPSGTTIVAFGENITETTTCKTKRGVTTCTTTTTHQVYDTPFTEAGDVKSVPEPGTITLFGTGLLSIAGMIRRRRKN